MQENEVTQADRDLWEHLYDETDIDGGNEDAVLLMLARHRQQAEDAMRERLIAAVNAERVDAEATGDEGDALYNRALDDAQSAIRAATLSKEGE